MFVFCCVLPASNKPRDDDDDDDEFIFATVLLRVGMNPLSCSPVYGLVSLVKLNFRSTLDK